jgi:hypothetical protein
MFLKVLIEHIMVLVIHVEHNGNNGVVFLDDNIILIMMVVLIDVIQDGILLLEKFG